MRYLRLSVTICVCVVALLACGENRPEQLREATKADLQQLLLTEDDAGSSYSLVRDGIEGVVGPCLPDDQICHVILKPGAPADDGTICAYVEVQWVPTAERAKEDLERIRDAYTEGAQYPEVGIEMLHPGGLVDGAVASYSQDSSPLCSPGTGPAHRYGVIFQRSNLAASVSVWSVGERGPEEVVSLANKQAGRIDEILAHD